MYSDMLNAQDDRERAAPPSNGDGPRDRDLDRDRERDRPRDDDRERRRSPPPEPRRFGGGGGGPRGRNTLAPTPTNVLGVFGLSVRTVERDLEDLFNQFGTVQKVTIVYDQRQSDRSRGFGFIRMATVEDATKCIAELNGRDVNGRNIRVDYSVTERAHDPTPGKYMGAPDRERRPGYDRDFGGRGDSYRGGRDRDFRDRDYRDRDRDRDYRDRDRDRDYDRDREFRPRDRERDYERDRDRDHDRDRDYRRPERPERPERAERDYDDRERVVEKEKDPYGREDRRRDDRSRSPKRY